jgi:hypothetical protein
MPESDDGPHGGHATWRREDSGSRLGAESPKPDERTYGGIEGASRSNGEIACGLGDISRLRGDGHPRRAAMPIEALQFRILSVCRHQRIHVFENCSHGVLEL